MTAGAGVICRAFVRLIKWWVCQIRQQVGQRHVHAVQSLQQLLTLTFQFHVLAVMLRRTHDQQPTRLTKCCQNSYTIIQGFDAGLANRSFLVCDFRALWRSALSARKSQTVKGQLASLASNLLVAVPSSVALGKTGLILSQFVTICPLRKVPQSCYSMSPPQLRDPTANVPFHRGSRSMFCNDKMTTAKMLLLTLYIH